MSFKQFVKSKTFFIHLGLIVASFLLLLVISFFVLKIYTRHGQEYIVPDIEGKVVSEIEQMSEMKYFDLVVIDSIFKEDTPSGTILSQEPVADSKVKKGRKIYVTVSSLSGDELNMP